MDPLNVAASLVGLLTAAGSVASILFKVKSVIYEAPRLMDELLSQINEPEAIFVVVNHFLARISTAPR
jgi:hypothetical protein